MERKLPTPFKFLTLTACLWMLHTIPAFGQIDNTYLGTGAASSITTGDYNTMIGDSAAADLSSGSGNVMVGEDAGRHQRTAFDNVFIGWDAGYTNTTGTDNVFVGARAGRNSTSTDNTFIGTQAGYSNTSGSDNTFMGEEAGRQNTTGRDNVFIGEDAGYNNTDGDDNTFVGSTAGRSNTLGRRNTFIGNESGYDNTSGDHNTGIGDSASVDCAQGHHNTTVGAGSGAANEHGDYLTAVGVYAGYDNNRTNDTALSDRNTYLGAYAGYSNRVGEDNVGIGAFANFDATDRSRTTYIGATADADHNDVVIVGYNGLASGEYGVSIGSGAASSATGAMALGYMAQASRQHAISLGRQANVSDENSIGIGYLTMVGRENSISIGDQSSVAAAHSIAIGAGSSIGSAASHTVAIGAGATANCYNCMVLGGTSESNRVNVGIGTDAPDTNASLELTATDRGFLINRLSNAERMMLGDMMDTDDEGMMVYDHDEDALYIWNGMEWMTSGKDEQTLSRTGNTLSIQGGNSITLPDSSQWTTNGSAVYYNDNVGIGTTAPAARMHVSGGDVLLDNGRYLTVTRSDDSFPQQVFGMDGNNDILLNRSAIVHGKISRTVIGFNARSFDVRNQNNQTLLRVMPNGDVGINQTSPSFAMDINGDGRITTDWIVSDKRYKKNIHQVESALSKVHALRGVSYQYRTEEFKEKRFKEGTAYGFVAQEVQGVLPELVTADKEGFYVVNYDGVVPILTEAIKEQQKELEQKDQMIRELQEESRNTTLENQAIKLRLDQLEQMMRTLCDDGCPGLDGNQRSGSNTGNKDAFGAVKGYLYQNEPNPFREKTSIRYEVPAHSRSVAIIIYNLQGEQVKTFGDLPAGEGSIELTGGTLKAGAYMYSLITNGEEIDTKRMIMTK